MRMKWICAKPIRVLSAIGVFLACFCYAYVYYKYLYVNGGILSVSAASQYPVKFMLQAVIVNAPILVILFVAVITLGKRALESFDLKVPKKSAQIIVSVLGVLYVAFLEEFEFRALIPAFLKERFNKYVEWLLPNVLFACSHLLIPMIQGKSVSELFLILLNSISGYVLLGIFWEWCKRKSGSLWVGVLIHAIMDFGL